MRLLPSLVSSAGLFALSFAGTVAGSAAVTPATIQVPDGFEVIPVALPPLVKFPMLGNFDERGRLFLAENAGVNLDEKELDAKLPSQITLLEDTDGDGVFDRSSVFADRLAFPQGALWHDGALYVTSAPSVWRLEDRDGDGRAETRTEIARGFKSTGNAADVHGPFLHPNGRLYWCHGRKGHEVYQNNGGALVSKGLGARIWSCRPDGSDIEVHAGGGMDNPVEVAFNQEGEIFGTANIFRGSPRSDAILHWVHGGVYPRTDQEPVLAEFKRTGDLLPPVALIGHVAPSGLCLPRAGVFASDSRAALFYAEFNTRRIMRVELERHGATYRGHAQPFATAADSGVHFTDVLEDADGSLLVVDTGAWFRRGCPTSVVARADLTGGIYRLRRRGAPAAADPRGQTLAWRTFSAAELTPLLGDARPAVRDRAVAELARRGAATVPALAAALDHRGYLVRSNAVWALTRIGTAPAQGAARRALGDGDARIREAACQSAFITRDTGALAALVDRLRDETPAVRREAARALGRLKATTAVPGLGEAVAAAGDPVLMHALIYALIEIDALAETRKLLSHPQPLVQRAALIALDRSSAAPLDPAPVFTALRAAPPELRRAALEIAVRHPEWGSTAAEYLSTGDFPPADTARREIVSRLLPAFLGAPDVQAWVRNRLLPGAGAPATDLLLEAVASSQDIWDEAWRDAIVGALRSPELRRAQAGLRAVAAHRKRNFAPALQEVGRDASRPTAFRVAALQLAAGADNTLDATSFGMLLEPLAKGGAPDARLQAATVLAGAKLTRAQLFELLNVVPLAGPMELQQMLGAFQRGPADPEVGVKLLAQLQESPGRWGVMQTTLQTIFQRYPAPAYENAAPLIAEIMNQNVAKDGRVAELETLATGGNPAAGRTAFLAGAGACLTCHRVGETGGTMGPDLSHIGRIRSTRDLLEAVAFPNASIARGYESFQVSLRDGNSLVGTIPREAADTVFVVTADGREHPVSRANIAKLEPVPMSLMPPGLDRALEVKVLADLVAYLKSLE